MRACIAAKLLPETIDANSAFSLMSMGLFGVATLRLSGRITRTEDADALAADMLDTVIAGLQSGITLRASAVLCSDDALHTTPRSHAS